MLHRSCWAGVVGSSSVAVQFVEANFGMRWIDFWNEMKQREGGDGISVVSLPSGSKPVIVSHQFHLALNVAIRPDPRFVADKDSCASSIHQHPEAVHVSQAYK